MGLVGTLKETLDLSGINYGGNGPEQGPAYTDAPIGSALAIAPPRQLNLEDEVQAVEQICREYSLRTSVEASLAALLVRNLKSAQEYAKLEDARRAGRNWYEQRIELIRAAADQRLKAERGVFRAAQAILWCRLPQSSIFSHPRSMSGRFLRDERHPLFLFCLRLD